jgi:hypothetical protein
MVKTRGQSKSKAVSDSDDTNSKPDTSKSDRRISLALVIIIMVLLLGTAGVMLAALITRDAHIPDDIDVVLYESSESDPAMDTPRDGKSRIPALIAAVRKNMSWVRRIYVMTSDDRSDWVDTDTVKYVKEYDGDLTQAFLNAPNLTGIADHCIFLGDNTFPMCKIEKTYLYSGEKRRMFNVMRDYAQETYFSSYLETTMPTLVQDTTVLKKFTADGIDTNADYKPYMVRETFEDHIVLWGNHRLLVRDVLINGDSILAESADFQLKEVVDDPPLFAVFHVSGDDDASRIRANTLVFSTLNTEFM